MSGAIEAVVLATIGVVLLSVWLVLFRRYLPHGPRERNGQPARPRTCPLCGTQLRTGENVRSALFPGKPDRMMHVFGCPHCLPPDGELRRICPVCRKELPPEGYLIGRYFEGPGRKHLHVLGCTSCRFSATSRAGTH